MRSGPTSAWPWTSGRFQERLWKCRWFPGRWTWTSPRTWGWRRSTKRLLVTRLVTTLQRRTQPSSEWQQYTIFSSEPCIFFREFEHPRFGCIMSVVALRDIEPGEEVSTTSLCDFQKHCSVNVKNVLMHIRHPAKIYRLAIILSRCLSVTITA